MKVCLLTSSFPRNPEDPAGIFIYHLAKWLAKKNINVCVIAPHDGGCKFFETRDDFKIIRFPYFLPLHLQKLCYGSGIIKNIKEEKVLFFQVPFFFLSQILYATLTAKKFKADIIHAHWSIPQGFTGLFIKTVLNIPCITTLHGSDVFSLRKGFMNALNTRVIRQSDAVTANSSQTAGAAKHLSYRKVVFQIPMGVDTDFFKKSEDQLDLRKEAGKGRIVLYVGRLIDWKGVDYLISAMPEVLSKYSDTRLIIAGEGPDRYQLEQLAKKSGHGDKITFRGSLSQEALKDCYAQADVFVLPSIENDAGETEGLGVVLLEAMASSVSVIGSHVGGIGDIVKHETTGLLVPQKNPTAIAHGIIRLFEDNELRKKLTESGRQLVEEQFSWDVVSDRFIQLYHDRIKAPSHPEMP